MISPWTPSKIETALWLDAADPDTITVSDTGVSEWLDKSGNDRHATQDDPNRRPQITENKILFDGSDDFLHSSSVAPLVYSPWSIFIIYELESYDNPGELLYSFNCSGGNTLIVYPNKVYDSENKSFTNQITVNERKLLHVSYSSGTISGFENGNPIGSFGVSLASGSNQFSLAQEWDSSTPSDFMHGSISEIVMIPKIITDFDRFNIEGYLAHKWGLSGNLPSDHPYKISSPVTFSGIIRDRNNTPCERRVYCIDRDMSDTKPTLFDHTLSDPITGEYTLTVPNNKEYCVVALSDESKNLNDLIARVSVNV